MSSSPKIFHACDPQAWIGNEACYFPSQPFIHFSTWSQLAESLAIHQKGKKELLLFCIDPEKQNQTFLENLKWEASRHGQLFPHLYQSFQESHCEWIIQIEAPQGTFDLSKIEKLF
jgi:uncharacterized protein (DUF952 family)